MGPPRDRGGEDRATAALRRFKELQWGRLEIEAESVDDVVLTARHRKLQWGRLEIEAERGKTLETLLLAHVLLQWGRLEIEAERKMSAAV